MGTSSWMLATLLLHGQITLTRHIFSSGYPENTGRRSDFVLQLLLRRDVVPPYHDVVSSRRQLKDVQATLLCC